MKILNASVLTKQVNKSKKVLSSIQATKTGLVVVGLARVKKDPTPKVAKVLFLKDGIKGKQLVRAKIDTNNAHKGDAKSMSFCIKRLLQFDMDFLASFEHYDISDITPLNLAKQLKGTEGNERVFGVVSNAASF